MAYKRSLSPQHQLEIFNTISKQAPKFIKSTYTPLDLINDVFLDYFKKKGYPESYQKDNFSVDVELIKKLVYHRRFSNDRPKYLTHRTSQYDATELEQIARSRLVLDTEVDQDSELITWLRQEFTKEIERRWCELFEKVY